MRINDNTPTNRKGAKMAIERTYTEPMQLVHTPVAVERIKHLSDIRRVSKAAIVREFVDAQIEEAERRAGIADGEERAERVVRDAEERLAHTQ